MQYGEIVVIVIIALIIGGALAYIVKAKKSGKKCIGCPDGCSCGGDKNAKKEDGEQCSCNSCGTCGSCGGCNACHNDKE